MKHHLSENNKQTIYFITVILLHILYFFTFLGMIYLDERYVKLFNIGFQIGICVILLLRFNSYNQHKMTNFDRTLIISAASFLLFNLFMTELYHAYIVKTDWYNRFLEKINNHVKNINSII